ncbi:MAG: hypothetical protein R2725_13270 [Solirubrobacterales bacterium]
MVHTTLNEPGGIDLPIKIREAIYRYADRAQNALGSQARGQVAALQTLADYIGTLSSDDPRIWQQACVSGTRGDREEFHPVRGKLQERLLSSLGDLGATAPPPEVSLAELLAAGVSDLIEDLSGKVSAAKAELERERVLNEELRKRSERGEELEVKLGEANNEVSELKLARGRLQETVEHLKLQLSARPSGSDQGRPREKPRRTRVDGHEGIYYREARDGSVVYQIGWSENGKQRWKTVGTDLQKAIDLRAQLSANGGEDE